MTCTNATCAIYIVCQNKDLPCPGNATLNKVIRNGYAAMARQEQRMRMSSIDFSGDWG
jgi:hypothetical protein